MLAIYVLAGKGLLVCNLYSAEFLALVLGKSAWYNDIFFNAFNTFLSEWYNRKVNI